MPEDQKKKKLRYEPPVVMRFDLAEGTGRQCSSGSGPSGGGQCSTGNGAIFGECGTGNGARDCHWGNSGRNQ